MKKLMVTVLAGAALLVPATGAFAAGDGGGIAAKVTALQAKVEAFQQKCNGAQAPKRCADKKVALAGKLGELESKLDARIAAAGGKAKKVAALQAARDQVASLIATL